MILIAHRGNINGPEPEMENKPEYILTALNGKFEVEIDVWYENNNWFLGHDQPQYKIDFEFLTQPKLWIHCKDYVTLQTISIISYDLNFFYHTNEDYVLTSKKYIWAYPGKPGGRNTICVMPEWHKNSINGFAGVCSDYIGKINDQINPIRS